MKKNIVILFITIVIIIGVIVFLESKKRNTSVVLETGESIETGILKSSELTGKNIGDRAPNWKLQSFEGELIELADFRGGPVMIDFFADWCMPGVMMGPMMNELSEKFDGKIKFGKVDVEDNQELAQKFNVQSIPNFVLLKDGKLIDQFIGSMSEEDFEDKLKKFV